MIGDPERIDPSRPRRPVQDATATVRAVLTPGEMARAEKLLRNQWPKQCGCCSRLWYPPFVATAVSGRWSDLVRVGQVTDEAGTLEMRNCPCTATLSVFLAIHDPDLAEAAP